MGVGSVGSIMHDAHSNLRGHETKQGCTDIATTHECSVPGKEPVDHERDKGKKETRSNYQHHCRDGWDTRMHTTIPCCHDNDGLDHHIDPSPPWCVTKFLKNSSFQGRIEVAWPIVEGGRRFINQAWTRGDIPSELQDNATLSIDLRHFTYTVLA